MPFICDIGPGEILVREGGREGWREGGCTSVFLLIFNPPTHPSPFPPASLPPSALPLHVVARSSKPGGLQRLRLHLHPGVGRGREGGWEGGSDKQVESHTSIAMNRGREGGWKEGAAAVAACLSTWMYLRYKENADVMTTRA